MLLKVEATKKHHELAIFVGIYLEKTSYLEMALKNGHLNQSGT